jgi:hypothetical protein
VLLGAGASCAAFPDGDVHGRKLPTMANFVETVNGLADYLDDNSIRHDGNIENLYSNFLSKPDQARHAKEVENLIHDYFNSLEMPEHPTLYDHLLLSLRRKDLVATFNWDPFLFCAFHRVSWIVGSKHIPHIAFLHGNVATGYCDNSVHPPMRIGAVGNSCDCGNQFRKCGLLYPIANKDYTKDPMIESAWKDLRVGLDQAHMLTIFGYNAPKTDQAAIELMEQAWGDPELRELEQIEIVDIKAKEHLLDKWSRFICREHAHVRSSIYRSYIMQFPRRSCDAFWDGSMQNQPRQPTPIKSESSWTELKAWAAPYIDVETMRVTQNEHGS